MFGCIRTGHSVLEDGISSGCKKQQLQSRGNNKMPVINMCSTHDRNLSDGLLAVHHLGPD